MPNNKVIKLTPTSKIFVALSSVIIVAIAGYNWIVSPQTSYLRAAHMYDVMVGDAGNMTKVIKNQMGSKKNTVKNLHGEIARIQSGFFTPKQASELFLDLEPIAHECECAVDSLTFMASESVAYEGKEIETADITVKRLAMGYTGVYKNIMKFLRRLGSYSQRIIISELNIESTGFSNDELSCQMIITIYMIEDKELGTDE
jgi:Tfp pilus assembly protein PilO